MNDTLNGIASTVPGLKTVRWKIDKIHAAICILVSACFSMCLIAWIIYVIL